MVSHRSARSALWTVAAAVLVAGLAGPAAAQDTRVSIGSPVGPFSQNKQNEPAVADRPQPPQRPRRGRQRQHRHGGLQRRPDNTCPFTAGVGVSGVYFSSNSGATLDPADLHRPERPRLPRRGRRPIPAARPRPGRSARCPTTPRTISCPTATRRSPSGRSRRPAEASRYANGSRLYYANLTSALPGTAPFKGAEAIAVSHTDNVGRRGRRQQRRVERPRDRQPPDLGAVLRQGAGVGRQRRSRARSSATSTSATPPSAATATAPPTSRSTCSRRATAATTWTQHQVTPATNNTHSRNGFGRSGCTVRTDSRGVVYVFDFQFGFSPTTAAAGQIQMIRSLDGGAHWQRPVNIFTAFDTCNAFEPSIGRCVEDGVGGARSDLSPAPSVDIANGAPTGADASNRIVLSWVDGRDGLNHEHVMFSTSTSGGSQWTAPRQVELGGDRGYYSAPAISPNGTDVWLVYNAFEEPFKNSAIGAGNDRPLIGQVLHATVGSGAVGAFASAHRGAVRRRARLVAERPRRRVPRRLRLRRGHAELWRGRVERRARSGGLPRRRPVPPGPPRRGGRHRATDRRGRGAARRERGP